MTDPANEPENENPIAEAVGEKKQAPGRSGRLPFPAVGQGYMNEKDEKKWAGRAHIWSLLGIPFVGIGYIFVPLFVYFTKRGESPFVDAHAKETLNFSILSAVVVLVSTSASVAASTVGACVSFIVPIAFATANLIFCIQGHGAAKRGEAYRYPWNFRLIR